MLLLLKRKTFLYKVGLAQCYLRKEHLYPSLPLNNGFNESYCLKQVTLILQNNLLHIEGKCSSTTTSILANALNNYLVFSFLVGGIK